MEFVWVLNFFDYDFTQILQIKQKMLFSSQGIDWYIYFGLSTKHLKNKRTLKIPVLLHHLFHILTASHDVYNVIPHLTAALKPI